MHIPTINETNIESGLKFYQLPVNTEADDKLEQIEFTIEKEGKNRKSSDINLHTNSVMFTPQTANKSTYENSFCSPFRTSDIFRNERLISAETFNSP